MEEIIFATLFRYALFDFIRYIRGIGKVYFDNKVRQVLDIESNIQKLHSKQIINQVVYLMFRSLLI